MSDVKIFYNSCSEIHVMNDMYYLHRLQLPPNEQAAEKYKNE